MKTPLSLIVASIAAISTALSPLHLNQAILRSQASRETQYLVEVGPGDRRWMTEDEKWALKREGINFMDVTDTPDLGASSRLIAMDRRRVTFPTIPVYNETLAPLLPQLSKDNMHQHLETFTSFFTRYFKSRTGAEASSWLLDQVNATVQESGAGKHGAFVQAFKHPWGQDSVIATIPGKSEKTVVIGAHLDSINKFFPSFFAAPGADDDGSGTVTILEALRVLLTSKEIIHGDAPNTIEFHWYSAEEGGLLGSQAIFHAYEREGRDVRAMLQQDMTGYVHKTLAAGEPESVGIITDYVDAGLTEFIKKIVTQYCTIPYVLTQCGYACSDHASATKAGYPSAFVIESDFKYSDDKIHTTEDKIKYLNFDHMVQHARLTLALVYELAFARLE